MAPARIITYVVCPIKAGISMHKMIVTAKGTIVSFQLFTKYCTPNAPNSAGRMFSNAGCNTGFSKIGVSGMSAKTPIKITSIVTRDEVAIDNVATILFSFDPASVFDISFALMAQGSFIFVILPVMNARYAPPAPRIGT